MQFGRVIADWERLEVSEKNMDGPMCGCCHRGIGVVQCFGHWCATWICLWCLVFGHDYPGMCTDCFEDFSDENLLCYDTSTVQILCNTAYVFSFN